MMEGGGMVVQWSKLPHIKSSIIANDILAFLTVCVQTLLVMNLKNNKMGNYQLSHQYQPWEKISQSINIGWGKKNL